MTRSPSLPLPPWSQRLFDRSPFSPFGTGALLALGLLLIFFGMEFALGRFASYEADSGFREDLRVAVVLCLVAGYLPAAWVHAVRSARQTADELVPSLTRGEQPPGIEQAGLFDRSELRRAGVVSLALVAAGLVLIGEGFALMGPEAYFHRLLLSWIGWIGGRAAYATWVESMRFSQLGRQGVRIDLLDLASVAPLIRYGLRQALVTIGAFSLLALMFYDSEAAPNLIWFLLAASLSFLVLAAVALLMPLRGVHDAIAREKAQELARVNDRIRRGLGDSEGRALPSLADWIAYRALIESVREWPIDAPTLRRFALYLAIPLGSWFGGAVAQRFVDALLD